MKELELADIAALTDPLGLWRLLVRDPLGRKLPAEVAVETFRRLHGDGAAGGYDSAALICTDRRWRHVSAAVIAGIADCGLLGDDEQDRLANSLLWPQQLDYQHPMWWIGTTFIEIDLDSPGPGRPVRIDPDTPVDARRHIWPPLRTWAAGRVIGRRLAAVDDVLDCARSLPARDGAAAVAGAMRGAGNLDQEQAGVLLDAALSWRHISPRKAALQHLLADGKADLVRTLASDDTDASIRSWASRQLRESDAPATLFD